MVSLHAVLTYVELSVVAGLEARRPHAEDIEVGDVGPLGEHGLHADHLLHPLLVRLAGQLARSATFIMRAVLGVELIVFNGQVICALIQN